MKEKGFSQILILISTLIMVLAIAGAYYLGTTRRAVEQKQIQTTDMNRIPTATSKSTQNPNYPYGTNYQILVGCNKDECLFNSPSEEGVVEGYAKLEGYIHTYEAEDYGNKVTCTSLLITGGNENLIKSFKTQIKNGNGLNKLDKDNNLLVNIGMNSVDPQIKSVIESSDINHKVELGVIRVTPQPRGASTCSSFVGVLFAKSLGK